MGWLDTAWFWLLEGAAGSLIVLTLGSLAAALCRQPVRRARVAVCALAGALVVPWLGASPFSPRWSAGLSLEANRAIVNTNAITTNDTATVDPRPGSARRNLADVSTDTAGTTATIAGTPEASAPVNRSTTLPDGRAVVLAAYVVATAAAGAWWAAGRVLLWRLVRTARPVSEPRRSRFLALSGPAGERVRLLETDLVTLPFTYTWIRPVIVLPRTLDDAEALDFCLAHEWSHVERNDARAWALASLAGLVLHYQPLYWWLRRQLRLCQDYIADDRAAAVGSAEEYAAFLVRMARARLGGPALPALGISDRRSNLYRRVVMLLTDGKPLEHRCRFWWNAVAVAATACVVVLASGLRLNAEPAAAPQAKPKVAAPAPNAPGGRTWNCQVIDKDSRKPLAGAKVLVRLSVPGDDGRDRTRDDHRLTTGDDGRYSFAVTAAQSADPRLFVWLEVECAEHVRDYGGYGYGMLLKNEQLGERPFFETIELPAGKTVTGRVVTPEGNPAAGVKVESFTTTDRTRVFNDGKFVEDWTDADGRFRLTVYPTGPTVLWVIPTHYNLITRGLYDFNRGDLGTFTLAEGITLSGKVVDGDGRPVVDVFVGAIGERSAPGSSPVPMGVANMNHRAVVTAADGTFSLGPFAPGTYRVAPTENGWNPSTRVGFDDPADRPLPAVFNPQKVSLEAGKNPVPLLLKAVPHVVIEA